MADWHESSCSGGTNECVVAREHQDGADVRDTQNRELGRLSFSHTEWNVFVSVLPRSGPASL
ncbi:DUF397 domain-containing protein [Nocardiopsis valliformis]|uniref:DUF397 domain-containing protein n=1 Tax=Nocardiopsis valliformis TaxID=239974 RepID=UPI00034B731F|nr:DUF397 domain-containing protein [Nocardiopsis valliformis]